MKFIIRVKPWAKIEGVKKLLQGYEVAVKEPAKDGKANIRAIELLAEFLQVSKRDIIIKTGQTSRYKIVEVRENLGK